MVFLEASIFTRRVTAILSDDKYHYAKNESDNLTPEQLKMLKHIVEQEYP